MLVLSSIFAVLGCEVKLLRSHSRRPCADASFGCYLGEQPTKMWVHPSCRGDFVCDGTELHCGTKGFFHRGEPGQAQNCTCAVKTVGSQSQPLPAPLAARRLNSSAAYDEPRFVPETFDEALHAAFTFWDVLDNLMRQGEPKNLWATGYVRELQARRMVELTRSLAPGATYCEVGMNGEQT